MRNSRQRIDGDVLIRDVRNIFHTRRADWLSLEMLVADLKRQPYAAYHNPLFDSYALRCRIDDFGVALSRRDAKPGYALADLRDSFRRFVTEPPRIVLFDSEPKE